MVASKEKIMSSSCDLLYDPRRTAKVEVSHSRVTNEATRIREPSRLDIGHPIRIVGKSRTVVVGAQFQDNGARHAPHHTL